MKKTSIFGIVVIAIAIAIIICTYGSSGSYGTFNDAKTGGELHVIGHVDKQKEMVYDATRDANYFSFYMRDTIGNECKVIYTNTKPEDFDKTDKIVLVGQMTKDGSFHAKTILMKCPSKYKNDKIDVEADDKKTI